MAIALALSFFPLLVFPIELIFVLKVFAFLGYRKISQCAIFDNHNRQKIYDAVRVNPAISFSELSRVTGVKPGTLKYHLALLMLKRKIVSFECKGTVNYFENSDNYTILEKNIFRQLRNATTRRILRVLIASPDVSRKDIVETIGITGPSVTWHTNQLSRYGIISITKNGRNVHYELTDEAIRFLKKHEFLNFE